MTTVDSWPKTLPMPSVGSWSSTTETHLNVHPFPKKSFQQYFCVQNRVYALCENWNLKIGLEVLWTRWVSVVEFHDPTLIIGKVFGQESTVVKWNYQILGLHPVAVRQKLGVILVIKWFKNWSQQKMLFTKKVRLNWYSSMNFFLERFGWFLT